MLRLRCVVLNFLFIFSLITSCLFLHADEYPKKFEGSFEAWEQKRLDLITLFLPHNPVILQAGGYYGGETIDFVRQWPNSKIISFEANPHAFEILSAKTANFKNIKISPLALNDHMGFAPFYVCHGSDIAVEYASSLLKPSQCMEIHYPGPVINVASTTLDEWCSQNGIDHIDFISMDLQGAELQALKGSLEMLKTVKCIYVHTNFFPFRVGTTRYPILKSFLEKAGFKLLAHWFREGLEGNAIFVKNDYFFPRETEEFLKNNFIDGNYQRYYEPSFGVYYDLEHVCDDSLKNILKQGLPYEGHIALIINQLTRPDSLAIDIGAHIGVHTVTMSRKTGPKGAVLAFEPHKRLYMELLQTLALNQCTNVIPIGKGSGDALKRVLYRNFNTETTSAECENEDFAELITLDSLKLDNLSLIKMDVENYEYFVLKGAKETILKNKPVIVFECWIGVDYERSDPKEKANFDRVISLIESYGYEIYVIFANDFIAFPSDATGMLANYKKNFRRLDLKAFDIGVK